MAYALGRVLHRRAGRRDARFSPTFQIPIAPGDREDPLRWRRRVVPALASVRARFTCSRFGPTLWMMPALMKTTAGAPI